MCKRAESILNQLKGCDPAENQGSWYFPNRKTWLSDKNTAYFSEKAVTVKSRQWKQCLFKQVEHATYDTVYLFHKEENVQAVREFIRRVDHTLKQAFMEDSLEAIKSEESGSQKIGELNSPQSVEISKMQTISTIYSQS